MAGTAMVQAIAGYAKTMDLSAVTDPNSEVRRPWLCSAVPVLATVFSEYNNS